MIFTKTHEVNPDKHFLVRLIKKWFHYSPIIDGQRFFVKFDGIWHATPLFIALIFLEFTDIIFAVESVPAIFSLTNEPMIVFTSNIFAILGLRSMFFLISGVIEKFYLIKYGLATILVFIGLKMVWLNQLFGGKFPINWSLGIIAACIGISIVGSMLFPQNKKQTV